ncbi:hypothetical protein VNO77_03882 [Canavalia gladiata]|uniref:Uncharacterized protein n=1 Tax=Canavalia gladiata TaxID=3824 RepID=A0AAN9N0N0_CANGL
MVVLYLCILRAANHEPRSQVHEQTSNMITIDGNPTHRIHYPCDHLLVLLANHERLIEFNSMHANHAVATDSTSLADYECDLEFFPARPLKMLKGSTTRDEASDDPLPLVIYSDYLKRPTPLLK